MVDESATREGAGFPADANPFQAPAAAPMRPARSAKGKLVLRVLEWTMGLPMTLFGLGQFGLGAIFFVLSFATEDGLPRSLTLILIAHGMMLLVPGVLLCVGRSWAALVPFVLGLLYLAVGFVTMELGFFFMAGLLCGFAAAILILAALVRHGRSQDSTAAPEAATF